MSQRREPVEKFFQRTRVNHLARVGERKGDITFKGSKERDFLISLMTKEARSAERMSELHKGWLRAKGWYILKEKRVI